MAALYESDVEEWAITLLEEQGWFPISPEQLENERNAVSEVVLRNRLKNAVDKLNPSIPVAVKEQAIRQVLALPGQNAIESNETFYRMLTEGVPEEYSRQGEIVGARVQLIDFDSPMNNDLAVCNQFTVTEKRTTRRPDVLLDLIRHFTVFEQGAKENPETGQITLAKEKKIAAYHQYHAVRKAVTSPPVVV